MVVVIDGPAGSGKSSTAKALAARLGFIYLDSGAVYRAVTWLKLQCEPGGFFETLTSSSLRFMYDQGQFRIWVNDREVTGLIRTPAVDGAVSDVAADPAVRERVNVLLRRYTAGGRFIADGRDLGTVVFPDAALKVFMVADLDARAARRHAEQLHAGVSREAVAEGLRSRDRIDSSRETAPLCQAPDARVVDTSHLTFDAQVALIEHWIRNLPDQAS